MQKPPAQVQAMPSDALGTPDGTELSIRGNTGHEPVAQLALRLTGDWREVSAYFQRCCLMTEWCS